VPHFWPSPLHHPTGIDFEPGVAMARPLRYAPPGSIHHIVARGNGRMPVFIDDADAAHFLEVLAEAVMRYDLVCYAYCLMPNHYHLLVETRQARLSAGMRHLNGVFAQWWNRRHDHVGHVFQGRFKSQLVGEEAYFLAVCRYITLNPVRAGLVEDPLEWRWSSHGAVVGHLPPPAGLGLLSLLRRFGTRLDEARRNYGRLIDGPAGADAPAIMQMIQSDQRIVGSRVFVERLREDLTAADRFEVPARQRLAARPPLADIVVTAPLDRRNESVGRACLDHAYTYREVARMLGLHPASVSRIVRPIQARRLAV
jgi:REP element-mobilizing transposase RayT